MKSLNTEYLFLENALETQKNHFDKLVSEIEKFDPNEVVEREKPHKEKMRKDLYAINSKEQRKMIDELVEHSYKPEFMYERQFGTKFYEYSNVIILLSAIIIESYINCYITLKIEEEKVIELFEDVEKIEIVKKWVFVPKLFLPDYVLDKSGELYNDLNNIVARRNRLAHYKPKLKVEDEVILKGKPLELKKYDDEKKLVNKAYSLPRRLVNHIGKYDKSITYLHFQTTTLTGRNEKKI